MKPRHAVLFSAVLLLTSFLHAFGAPGGVESVYFKTTAPPPVFAIPKNLRSYEGAFRAGLQNLPESALVNGALILGGQALGLTSQEATNLSSLLITTYLNIAKDSAFTNLPSALPYCFSAQRQTNGHYFLYCPEKFDEQTTVVVFLHGFGGNFEFYIWALKRSFPDAIILVPSWNVSWYGGSARYLLEALNDMQQRLHIKTKNRWLMGISAGGRGGFAIYPKIFDEFRGYVCLASAPEQSAIYQLKKNSRILMINGTHDPMIPIEFARKQVELAKRQVPSLIFREIDSNHFFILSQREETFRAVRQFFAPN